MSWARVTEIALLVGLSPPPSNRALVNEIAGLVAMSSEPDARVTEVAMLVAYKTGTPEPERRKAWWFDFDGHQFYCLDLGEEGTFVFDLTTGMWCEFQTKGYDTWNMRAGTKWGEKVVACDGVGNPIVWALDKTIQTDEGWKSIEHIVTGMLQLRNRKTRRQDSLRVVASVGQVGQDEALFRLRWSDDMGQTWSDYMDVVLEEGNFSQEIAYRSLGSIKAAGRVFELSDDGGVVRIDGATAEVEGTEEEALLGIKGNPE